MKEVQKGGKEGGKETQKKGQQSEMGYLAGVQGIKIGPLEHNFLQ